MIRLTYRATCSCGWLISCDAEAQAEVEGEAHLMHTRGEACLERLEDARGYPGCEVIVQKVRTWEEDDAR